jgi:hypothetical protein
LSIGLRHGWGLVVVGALLAPAAHAAEGGGLVGWVEDTRGTPVAGAVISVFGKGIRGGSLFTLADSEGQFILPGLPAGSYTLRAIGKGHAPSPARRITVLPDRDSQFTLSLLPRDEADSAEAQASEEDPGATHREWLWLLRHKRRSVLEATDYELPTGAEAAAFALAEAAPAPVILGALGGRVELVATSSGTGETGTASRLAASGLGSLELRGQLSEGVRWSLGGLLAEHEGRTWRMASEFVIEPGGGHLLETGGGYGAGLVRAPVPGSEDLGPERGSGALFLRDRWSLGRMMTASVGTRYSYLGFLRNSNHVDAVIQIEVKGDAKTLVRGSLGTRSLAPGGDLLTLSTIAATPAISWASFDDDLQPSRTLRYEMGIERSLGGCTRIGAVAFREETRNQMWGTFEDGGALRIGNVGDLSLGGLGFTLGQRFGDLLSGSVTYTFGQGRRPRRVAFAPHWQPAGLAVEEAAFHDVVARIETFIDGTGTRVVAFYRVNATSDEEAAGAGAARTSATTTRFDVQLSQGLPFLQPLTRAEWEILLAVRNLFYEASEGGFLDELVVQDPPTRVVGGISVRF